jgi:hypothetical protein
MKKLILSAATVLLITGCTTQPGFEYFGQTPPGSSALLFAPGIISLDDRNESMITFSPDGRECYFTKHSKEWNQCQIYRSVYTDTGWSTPDKAPFSADYSMCPSFSADGKQLFLAIPMFAYGRWFMEQAGPPEK